MADAPSDKPAAASAAPPRPPGTPAPATAAVARPAPASTGAASIQNFTPLPTGAKIGELVIQTVLGAGEFGITYLTEHAKRSKRYVMKEYFPRAIAVREGAAVRPKPGHESAFKWGLERFLSEARALQKVQHDSLVSLLAVTEMGGTGYVGMAYEQGREFGIWLHEHKNIPPQEELDTILGPLLGALEAAHAGKVFHLDLNPDCIIIRENGTPVLVDFGVYRVGLRRRLPSSASTTTAFAAPELQTEQGGPVGPWSDIYSMAALLYLAVTGTAPPTYAERRDGTLVESATKAAHGTYRRDFLAAIDVGLRLEPNTRPKDIATWRRVLLRKGGVGLAGSGSLVPVVAGLGGGALVGAIVSVALTGFLRSNCTGLMGCAEGYMLPLATLGAIAGAWLVLRQR